MSFITEWIMNIVVFILLAMIVDMLLPNSAMKKYTKMVTGLLLIAIILTPLLKVVAKDFDQVVASFSNKKIIDSNKVENLIESKKKEIQAGQVEYTLKQVGEKMKNDVKEELIDRFDKDIQQIKIDSKDRVAENENPIEKVIVYLSEKKKDDSVPIIKPVNISIGEEEPEEGMGSRENESILSMLSERWGIAPDQIELHNGEGGSRPE
ncbi:stage III sporulation protein AF [Heyndrickxia sporothermodurans]|uniref:stage III sporulation protein AF n=1 Tax=Heyndrickxia sporothermodurans TaxID=46224 RepID=UPI000D3BA861|nr:stage III sporulation protein AF [Heyndrickxia sporothermodurans]MBL5766024.1 stage III sporulation protein AF [Heyndrickxia sporothermodurans]MBL5769465.1 stage III sporulation protein AF [Heyndrickxia sporothermodurans]MBL5773246.1 stage III sporulation protein AF [Heyndrickxia sporothermodurans]MBL5777122.1 stage III sporulation protein AF [Heyndrickxia sporothermodurans]MBL5780531.1 stage III sporulation protein AF [Heyndrickxia sporothermodurans]